MLALTLGANNFSYMSNIRHYVMLNTKSPCQCVTCSDMITVYRAAALKSFLDKRKTKKSKSKKKKKSKTSKIPKPPAVPLSVEERFAMILSREPTKVISWNTYIWQLNHK